MPGFQMHWVTSVLNSNISLHRLKSNETKLYFCFSEDVDKWLDFRQTLVREHHMSQTTGVFV